MVTIHQLDITNESVKSESWENLQLLGFTDPQFQNASAFDHPNEKLLLTVLRYLLIKIDPSLRVEFQSCFPIVDSDARRSLKSKVLHQLQQLEHSNRIPQGCARSSVLSIAKGSQVHRLLWCVSRCAMVAVLSGDEEYQGDMEQHDWSLLVAGGLSLTKLDQQELLLKNQYDDYQVMQQRHAATQSAVSDFQQELENEKALARICRTQLGELEETIKRNHGISEAQLNDPEFEYTDPESLHKNVEFLRSCWETARELSQGDKAQAHVCAQVKELEHAGVPVFRPPEGCTHSNDDVLGVEQEVKRVDQIVKGQQQDLASRMAKRLGSFESHGGLQERAVGEADVGQLVEALKKMSTMAV